MMELNPAERKDLADRVCTAIDEADLPGMVSNNGELNIRDLQAIVGKSMYEQTVHGLIWHCERTNKMVPFLRMLYSRKPSERMFSSRFWRLRSASRFARKCYPCIIAAAFGFAFAHMWDTESKKDARIVDLMRDVAARDLAASFSAPGNPTYDKCPSHQTDLDELTSQLNSKGYDRVSFKWLESGAAAADLVALNLNLEGEVEAEKSGCLYFTIAYCTDKYGVYQNVEKADGSAHTSAQVPKCGTGHRVGLLVVIVVAQHSDVELKALCRCSAIRVRGELSK